MRKLVVIAGILVTAGALGWGFYLVGPPAEQRARTLDARREMDLQRLRLAADLFWTRNNRLPASLEELATEAGTGIYARDPQTGASYTYAVNGADTYELCAEFARASEQSGDFWSHGAGRQCYSITAKEMRP
jgi:hypothetical protein